MLAMLTDVDAVVEGWGTPDARPIARARPEELRRIRFASGSMAPKVEAACRFAETTGGTAAIGSLAQLGALVDGRSGTTIANAAAVVSA
jgi:carbamate kinase